MAWAMAIPAVLSAASSLYSGYQSGRAASKESKLDKTKRKTIDELLRSIKGQGPFSNLFQTDEAAFQKSFVDPAKNMFKSQIAPQIQQQSIAGGQQYGSELTGDLTRAGVNLDDLLNQYLMQFQESAKNRASSSLGYGMSGGGVPQLNRGEAFRGAAAGTLQNPQFMDQLIKMFGSQNQQPSSAQQIATNRRGFGLDY